MTERPQTNKENPRPPAVLDRVTKPAGVLPKNIQTWVILGVALLMIVVLAIDTPQRTTPPAERPAELKSVIDPNESRIQEYRRRIEERAQRLAAERARLEQAQQALGAQPEPLADPANSYPPPQYRRERVSRERSSVERDKEERAYQALFASNVAQSFRPKPERKDTPFATQNPPSLSALIPPTAGPDYRQPPLPFYVSASGPVPPSPQQVPNPQSPAEDLAAAQEPIAEENAEPTATKRSRPPALKDTSGADGKHYPLFEGTVLESVLTNRLTGSFAGPVNCMLTEDVYSRDRQRLLIPKGSRILGEVREVDQLGQERLAVVFHRIIMPDGFSLDLDQFQGLNQIGETGLKDKVDRHYLRLFGVSLAIGAIAGLAQAGTRYGNDYSAGDAYRQGVSRSVSASSLQILNRYLNVLPTFTVREGHRIKILLAGDLLVPAYTDHPGPSDF